MTKDLLGAFRLNMEPAVKPFHYTMSGLDNVWLMNGFHEEQTPYGSGVRVEDADNLHRVLAHVIVSDKAAMRGAELRFVRKLMGLSQHGLSRLLGCADQRVARWEKGQTQIDPSAERLTRMIVREWLGENCALMATLSELAELDEAIHGGRKLEWRDAAWRQAA
jgi:DNA-binding transcriptional regulator YiaG